MRLIRPALAYWHRDDHEVFVVEDAGRILGTYFMCANQSGGGDHVANCGFMTSQRAERTRVARAMLEHSLARARTRGFLAMHFNFVVSTNVRALKTWEAYGFEIVGRLPSAFKHPDAGFVDAFVMYKHLTPRPADGNYVAVSWGRKHSSRGPFADERSVRLQADFACKCR